MRWGSRQAPPFRKEPGTGLVRVRRQRVALCRRGKDGHSGRKPKQQLVPYFIASHPGSTANEMIDLALYLKRNGYRPDQVQDFIPAPFDIATCMWYTGLDPFTMKPVTVAKGLSDRKVQRALMQFFKPENYFAVREALIEAGRGDLIGGCDGLIPANPPKEALEKRRKDANPDHYHAVPNKGYRPGRATQRRRHK